MLISAFAHTPSLREIETDADQPKDTEDAETSEVAAEEAKGLALLGVESEAMAGEPMVTVQLQDFKMEARVHELSERNDQLETQIDDLKAQKAEITVGQS